MWCCLVMALYVVSTYGSLRRLDHENARIAAEFTQFETGGVLFLHDRFRFRRGGVVVRTADTQCIHAILEHAPADSELGRGVSLHIVVLFQGVKNDLPLEFPPGFFEREAAGKGIVS